MHKAAAFVELKLTVFYIHQCDCAKQMYKNNRRQAKHKFIVLCFVADCFHCDEHRYCAAAKSCNHKKIFGYSFLPFSCCGFVVNGDNNGKCADYNVNA